MRAVGVLGCIRRFQLRARLGHMAASALPHRSHAGLPQWVLKRDSPHKPRMPDTRLQPQRSGQAANGGQVKTGQRMWPGT